MFLLCILRSIFLRSMLFFLSILGTIWLLLRIFLGIRSFVLSSTCILCCLVLLLVLGVMFLCLFHILLLCFRGFLILGVFLRSSILLLFFLLFFVGLSGGIRVVRLCIPSLVLF